MSMLTWPDGLRPASIAWRLEPNTAAFVSPLTGAVQTYELPGARWVADIELDLVSEVKWRAWTALHARLRGQAGRVRLPLFHVAAGSSCARSGATTAPTSDSTAVSVDSTAYTCDAMTFTSLGAPRVDGAGQSGAALDTDGWTPGADIFAAGDFFHYTTTAGQTLHMVVEAAIAGGDGRARLAIEPPIRTAPANDAALEIDAPTAVMMLADKMQGAPQFSPGVFAQVSVALREVF